LEEGSASSTTPVSSQGPFGQLQSQGFKLQDKGKIVYFTGPARLVLNSAGKTSGAP
jgi:lipopolysaccharide export system protein LptC